MDAMCAVEKAKPNWAYIGFKTPGRTILSTHNCKVIENMAAFLADLNCRVIFKRSCGEELWKRNEGVTLP